ncbi:hypothetical protein CLOM_g1461 [Closterium sp. NIES-68]|nr:hypothetical protein CLOM_g1461 [Closterium sp. NIES-68]GJP68887.1 hypothetical protein CLOP_g25534 [Closterium sp. NIES-67]GJP72856.1 hypothetical protein CLOP_g3621 [Closterium sp. NIES-67]
MSSSSCLYQRGAPLTRTAPLDSMGPVRSTWRQVSRRRAAVVVAAVGGDMRASSFAKEMERVAAKEALLLAIKDAGGVESLSTGQGNAAGRIQVSERVVALERLNPTTRPTSSPLLEGYWDFVWAGARSPGLVAARLVLQRLPPQVVSLEALQLHIMAGTITATAVIRFLNSAESNVIIKSNLEMEASLKLKEEYAEIEVTTPVVTGGSIPAPLKAVVDQLASLLQSLPAALQDTINAGLRVPLEGRYSRELLVSYLDDELMIARDDAGLVDVLVRADSDGWVSRSEEGGVESFTNDPTDYIS